MSNGQKLNLGWDGIFAVWQGEEYTFWVMSDLMSKLLEKKLILNSAYVPDSKVYSKGLHTAKFLPLPGSTDVGSTQNWADKKEQAYLQIT